MPTDAAHDRLIGRKSPLALPRTSGSIKFLPRIDCQMPASRPMLLNRGGSFLETGPKRRGRFSSSHCGKRSVYDSGQSNNAISSGAFLETVGDFIRSACPPTDTLIFAKPGLSSCRLRAWPAGPVEMAQLDQNLREGRAQRERCNERPGARRQTPIGRLLRRKPRQIPGFR
jgi:hypothetical protein